MQSAVFIEKQQFRQWWLWVLLIVLAGIFISGYVVQVIYGEPFGNKPMSDTGLMIMGIVFLLLLILFWVMALHTRIDNSGIHVRFSPFHRRDKAYPWETIKYCEMKKYSPVGDYGGWGLRNGAYNVSGNYGVLITFKNRDTLMIGTNKPAEMTKFLDEAGKLKSNL